MVLSTVELLSLGPERKSFLLNLQKLTLGIRHKPVWFRKSSRRYVSGVWKTWSAYVGRIEC
ncbi:unnamed protein product, partial [Brassica oleracea]